jgi:hypothetical protein
MNFAWQSRTLYQPTFRQLRHRRSTSLEYAAFHMYSEIEKPCISTHVLTVFNCEPGLTLYVDGHDAFARYDNFSTVVHV